MPKTAKYPVNFPVSREFAVETGSHPTASTTTHSLRTASLLADGKCPYLRGISWCPLSLLVSTGFLTEQISHLGLLSLAPKFPFVGGGNRGPF
jgi:hypothetical protein